MRIFRNLILFAGACKLSVPALTLAKDLNDYDYYDKDSEDQRRKQLARKFGKTYALVTGATSGIGLEISRKLADVGFDLLLISRDARKLDNLKTQLSQKHPGVNIVTIPVDFKERTTSKDYDQLRTQILKYDVGILVNNVGVMHLGEFEKMDPAHIKEQLAVNMLPMAELTRICLEHIRKRQEYSSIVTIGSEAGVNPSGYAAIYSGTKAFNNHLTGCLSDEYDEKDRLEFLLVEPGPTRTNAMARFSELSANPFVEDADIVAENVVNRIGNGTRTFKGCKRHEIYGFLLSTFAPVSLWVKTLVFQSALQSLSQK